MQVAVMEEWSITAGTQELVLWHESQVTGAGTWLVGLPGAVLPLWQVKHDAVIEE